jgi:hypothetical protein
MPDRPEFRLLGTVEARVRGHLIDLGRRLERCLLGLLLVEANRPIPTDRLLDLLWETPGPAARGTLRTYVTRLRSRLVPDGVELRRSGAGYVIDVDPPNGAGAFRSPFASPPRTWWCIPTGRSPTRSAPSTPVRWMPWGLTETRTARCAALESHVELGATLSTGPSGLIRQTPDGRVLPRSSRSGTRPRSAGW